jgi:outer membrane protein TolC
MQLLERRPDIRASERQLAAANARIGVATANLFPRIAITGGLGWQGQGLGVGPTINNFIWSAGPSAYFPLLDLGTLDSLVQVQDLRTQELLADYHRTLLNAFEEVDDAITNDAAQRERLRHLDDAVVASKRAYDLASDRYDRGLTDQLNVVDAESQLYELQNQYEIARQDVILQSIALYKALGGGWENYQVIPPLRAPLPAILATAKQIADAAGLQTREKTGHN